MDPRRLARRSGLTHVEAAVLFFAFCGLWCCVSGGLVGQLVTGAYTRSSRVKCSNTLRQLALAAIQYADDHRAFPQVGGRELAGGVDTNATPKVVRALLWTGYHDNPEGFICPDSFDLHQPITDSGVKGNLRRWFWGGETKGDPERSPLVDDLPDPVLDRTDELSYGWVRRSMPPTARASAALAADRAQVEPALREGAFDASVPPGAFGNHDGGSWVVRVDGTCDWVVGGSEEALRLASVEDPARDGFLAVRPPMRPGGRLESGPSVALAWLGLIGPPLAVFALLLWRALRAAGAPTGPIVIAPADAVVRVRPSRVEALGPDERLKLGLGAAPTAASPVVLQHQQRCPACHDVVRADDALSRCLACRAVFHGECVPPGGECPTLGCRAG